MNDKAARFIVKMAARVPKSWDNYLPMSVWKIVIVSRLAVNLSKLSDALSACCPSAAEGENDHATPTAQSPHWP